MKTAISIPDDVFRAAEAAARRLSISRSQFFTRAVEEFLAVHSEERITEQLDAIYAEQSAEVDAKLSRMQTLSLGNRPW